MATSAAVRELKPGSIVRIVMRSEASYLGGYVAADVEGLTIDHVEIMIDGRPNEPRDGEAFIPWSSISLLYYAPICVDRGAGFRPDVFGGNPDGGT